MLVDECDLSIIDDLTICIVRSGKVNSQPYASFSHKGTREEKKNKIYNGYKMFTTKLLDFQW